MNPYRLLIDTYHIFLFPLALIFILHFPCFLLLMELEAATSQAADLHARKQSLLLELQGIETDLTAALARSHALQSSVEEHQRVYDFKLQTLIALVPPPAPPVALPGGGASKTTVTRQLQKHVTDLLGHLHAMEHPATHTTTAKHHQNHQQATPQLVRQVPGRVAASEVRIYIINMLLMLSFFTIRLVQKCLIHFP